MVNLYIDPDGKNIVLTTATKRESTSPGATNGMEMKKLQMRISELEKSLQQHVSYLPPSLPPSSLSWVVHVVFVACHYPCLISIHLICSRLIFNRPRACARVTVLVKSKPTSLYEQEHT